MNFDGLSGPTHFYGGLSWGNLASMTHRSNKSNPKKAALQGLEKMKLLMDCGMQQAILPPHERPSIFHLRTLGFCGTDQEVLAKAAKDAPHLLTLLSSSSSMWCANAATVTPSIDAEDGELHFTVANLLTEFHRSIEAPETYRILKKIFPKAHVHAPLPNGGSFGDEGAANHIRFCPNQSSKGVHLFVYGHTLLESSQTHFPARQCKEASEAIIRRHKIPKAQVVLAKQNPVAIEEGVFHNDVISMGHEDLFIYHERAFERDVIQELKSKFPELRTFRIDDSHLSLHNAVKSYLFNSQIVTSPKGESILIAPTECEKLDLSFLPFEKILFVNLRQSMQNGGGPACLRLRVVLNNEEKAAAHPGVFLTDELYQSLVLWVEKHYRESLSIEDLADPQLLLESRVALNELTQILRLGSIYLFQE